MRTYLGLAAAEFRRYSTYRAATLAGIATNSVFGFIRLGLLLATVSVAGGQVRGYTAAQAASYVWLGQAFLAPVSMWAWKDLAERVGTGDIAVDLARPLDLQLSWWARDLGRAAFALPTRGVGPALVGALTVGLAVPPWSAVPLGLLSLALGVSISFMARYAVNLIAFWVLDIRGYLNLYVTVLSIFSGFYLPIALFPGWLQRIAYASPFPAMFQTPIDIASGRVHGVAVLPLLAAQVGWLLALSLGGRWLTRRATRRLVVQGG